MIFFWMCFAEVPTAVYGEHLRQQVENRLKFYETGEKPEKNAEVMARAEAEVRIISQLLPVKFYCNFFKPQRMKQHVCGYLPGL